MKTIKKSLGIIGRVLAAIIGDPDMKPGVNTSVMWNGTVHPTYINYL